MGQMPERACVICGGSYPPTTKAQQCCGTVCSKIKGGRTMNRRPLCARCGGPVAHSGRIYCRRRCAFDAQMAARGPSRASLRRAARALLKCSECGGSLTGRRRAICSEPCRKAHNRQRFRDLYRSDYFDERDCPICGTTFSVGRSKPGPRSATCSPECGRIRFADMAGIRRIAVGGTDLSLEDMPNDYVEVVTVFRRLHQELYYNRSGRQWPTKKRKHTTTQHPTQHPS